MTEMAALFTWCRAYSATRYPALSLCCYSSPRTSRKTMQKAEVVPTCSKGGAKIAMAISEAPNCITHQEFSSRLQVVNIRLRTTGRNAHQQTFDASDASGKRPSHSTGSMFILKVSDPSIHLSQSSCSISLLV